MKTIYLIEDDRDIRDAITEVLSLEGFRVTAAENGAEALRDLSGMVTLPDLILLDLIMPVMDGYEFRRHQKIDAKLSQIPVVVMTANQLPNPQTLSVAGFLRKPVSIEEIVTCLKSVSAA